MLTKSFIKLLPPASRLPPPADPDFRRDVASLRCRLATGYWLLLPASCFLLPANCQLSTGEQLKHGKPLSGET